MPSRRSFLAAVGAAGAAATAGCVTVERPSRRGAWPAPGASDARTSNADGRGPTGFLYAAWSTDTGSAQPTTPAVVEGTVYVLGSNAETAGQRRAFLAAYDAGSGGSRWETTLCEPGGQPSLCEPGRQPSLSRLHVDGLRFHEGLLYARTFDGVHAVWAGDGTEQWFAPLPVTAQPFPRVAAPVVQSGTLVAGAYGDRAEGPELRGYNAATGAQRWHTSLPAYADLWTLAAADGTVYAPFLGDGDVGRGLVAVDAESGTVRWSWSLPVDGPVTVVDDSLVVPLREDGTESVAVVDRSTRELLWRRDARRRVDSGVAVADRVVYAVDDGTLLARRLDTGDVVWSFGNDTRRVRFGWTPAVAGDVVYAMADVTTETGSPSVLFALDVETGAIYGSGRIGSGWVPSTLAVVEGAAYLTLGGGELRCVESCVRSAFDRCVLG